MNAKRGLIAGAVVILLAVGGLALFLSRGGGLVEETLALQQQLLAGEASSRELKAGVDRVMRNVDKMSRKDVKAVRVAFNADCRRLQEAGIDAYFAAADEERESLLDRDVRRLVAAGELWFATNPWSSGKPPPARPRPAAKAKETPPTPEATARIERFEGYRAALVARAGKNRVSVPQWLLVPPRRANSAAACAGVARFE